MYRRALLAAALAVAFTSAASAATVKYVAHLSAKQEVPKTDSKGSGHLNASYDTNSKVLTYTLTFEGLTGPATMAHFHGPAPRGQNAGVLIVIGKDVTSPVNGTATLTDEQAAALKARKMYVNVHTAANPGGEIRGQVVPVSTHTRKKPAAPTSAS